jgi:hypothetical protein
MEKFKGLLECLKKDFPTVEPSFREQFSAYYVLEEYPKAVNAAVGISSERKLYRNISFGGYNESFNESPDNVGIVITIAIAIFDPQIQSYAYALPPGTKFTSCPRSFEIRENITFSETTGEFRKNGKPIAIAKFIKRKARQNEQVLLPVRGLPLRVMRWLKWTLVSKLVTFLFAIFRGLYYLCTGNKLVKEMKSGIIKHTTDLLALEKLVPSKDTSPNGKKAEGMSEVPATTIDFFGMKVNVAPLITYSILNLFFYFLFYLIGFKPPILKYLFGNTLLLGLYAIVSYFFLSFLLGRFFHLLSQVFLDFENLLALPKRWRYVK